MVCPIDDNPNLWNIYGFCIVSKLYVIKRDMFIGDNMEKWKELSAGKKRFWVAVGIIVVVAVVGWVTGWWSSPDVPVQ